MASRRVHLNAAPNRTIYDYCVYKVSVKTASDELSLSTSESWVRNTITFTHCGTEKNHYTLSICIYIHTDDVDRSWTKLVPRRKNAGSLLFEKWIHLFSIVRLRWRRLMNGEKVASCQTCTTSHYIIFHIYAHIQRNQQAHTDRRAKITSWRTLRKYICRWDFSICCGMPFNYACFMASVGA